MRVRCYLLSGGLSPGRALLSGFDRLSVPDRRSPTSCFSASDRVSFQIVVLSRFAYRRPTASHRCPSWSPWGCRESCWIAQDYRTKIARLAYYLLAVEPLRRLAVTLAKRR